MDNKDYKEFKDKDCREVYRYKTLFGDVFNNDKYAVTPSKLCCTGFAMFEDSGTEDHRDEIPVDVESSGSNDEGVELELAAATMDMSGPHSGDKWKEARDRVKKKKKKKKVSAWDVLYSVDRAITAGEKVVAKIDQIIGPAVSNPKTCMQELLATGLLKIQTDLYYWTWSFLSDKHNRGILDMQDNANEKFKLVESSWQEYRRRHPL